MKPPRPQTVDISSKTLTLNSCSLPCPEPLLILGEKASGYAKTKKEVNDAVCIDCKGLDLNSLFVEAQPKTVDSDGEETLEIRTTYQPGKLMQAAMEKTSVVLENLDQAQNNSGQSLSCMLEAILKPGASFKFAQKEVKFEFSQVSLGPTFSLTLCSKSLSGEIDSILKDLSPEALSYLQILQVGKEKLPPTKEKKSKKSKDSEEQKSYILEDF